MPAILTLGSSAFSLQESQGAKTPAVYRLVDALKPIAQWHEIRNSLFIRGSRIRSTMTIGVPFFDANGLPQGTATMKIEYQFPASLTGTQRATLTNYAVAAATKHRDATIALATNPTD